MWFGEKSKYIAFSEEFIIGKQSIEHGRIPVSPEMKTKIRYEPNVYVLGIPISYKDEVKKDMTLYKVQESNIDNRVPLANTNNGTTQTILFRFDFTER